MQIEYNNKTYTVGNKYIIRLNNYHLRKDNETFPYGYTKVKAKLVLKKYMDAEMYAVDYHYGFIFEYKREWMGSIKADGITLPDALDSK